MSFKASEYPQKKDNFKNNFLLNHSVSIWIKLRENVFF